MNTTPETHLGGCFVILSPAGYADGQGGWTRDWREALQFRTAPDPYAACLAAAEALGSGTPFYVGRQIAQPEVSPG